MTASPKCQKSLSNQRWGTISSRLATNTQLRTDKARLVALLPRYTPDHPDVRKLKHQIEREEAAEAALAAARCRSHSRSPRQLHTAHQAPTACRVGANAGQPLRSADNHVNPVIQSQLNTLEAEITKHKDETQRLSKQVAPTRQS